MEYLISLPLSEVCPSFRQNEDGELRGKDVTVSFGTVLLTVFTSELNSSYSPNFDTP